MAGSRDQKGKRLSLEAEVRPREVGGEKTPYWCSSTSSGSGIE